MCFSPQKRKYLNDLAVKNQGVALKKVRVEKDIHVSNYAVISEISLDFDKLECVTPKATIKDVLHKLPLFDRVTVTAAVHNIGGWNKLTHVMGPSH